MKATTDPEIFKNIKKNLYLVLEMLHVNVPGGRDAYCTHEHASHVRRRRVGAVCRNRDEADVTFHISTELVVTLDGSKPGVLALGSTGNKNT